MQVVSCPTIKPAAKAPADLQALKRLFIESVKRVQIEIVSKVWGRMKNDLSSRGDRAIEFSKPLPKFLTVLQSFVTTVNRLTKRKRRDLFNLAKQFVREMIHC